MSLQKEVHAKPMVVGLIECNYKTSYSWGSKIFSLPYPNGRTLRPINLVYEVPTPFFLLYYQTHFIFLGGGSW